MSATSRMGGGVLSCWPIGSIYLSMSSTNPSNLFGGEWKEIGQGRVLMGETTGHAAGSTVNSGLPNISGTFRVDPDQGWCRITTSGCFTADTNGTRATGGSSGSSTVTTRAVFSASNSSTVYGASSIVQPPALFCYMFQRTA